MTALSVDPIADRLYGSGTFLRIANETDTVLAFGMAQWDGTRWDSIGHRMYEIPGSTASQVYWFIRYNAELYACGAFGFFVEPDTANGSFSRLDETTQRWEPLDCINPVTSGLGGISPRHDEQDNLYMTGFSTSICGYPEAAVFRYDADGFHEWSPYQQIPVDNGNFIGTVIEFEGMTYMRGIFRDPLSDGWCNLMRHNGSTWEYVPGWGTSLGAIKDVVIHNDVLYIVGAFREPGTPGNGLAAFDGQNWLDFGTGLELAIAPGYTSVLTLQWFHDDLYVGGQFTKAGGIPANGLAKWNGSQWCSLPGFDQEPGPNPQSVPGMAVWRDSLYIVGAFTELEGQPFNRVAQWIGGDAVSGCSVPISVPEISTEHVQLSVWLTDVNNWTVEMPYNERWSVTLYDNTGRTVQRQNVAGQRSALDLSGLSAGMYIVQAGDPSGKQFTAKLLMQ
ncbi:MAG: T9SS type A sorting domain-containing protein [Flavobacteriales bacterium]|nr:T9SS type A sorting domain-containing protein [Flavobacteriales bacterium]